jgi:hypothetical protein
MTNGRRIDGTEETPGFRVGRMVRSGPTVSIHRLYTWGTLLMLRALFLNGLGRAASHPFQSDWSRRRSSGSFISCGLVPSRRIVD